MSTSEAPRPANRRSPLDGLPPELQASIRAYVTRIVADAPPPTEDQKELVRRLFGPNSKHAQNQGDVA